MLNFHIGIPGIVPELMQCLAGSGPVRAAENILVLPRDEYRKVFLELVNARSGAAAPDSEALERVKNFTKAASALDTVAVSQPNFFGVPADVLRPRKAFPLAEARVERLSALVGSLDMTYHLVIVSQIDYILKMKRMSETERLVAIRDAQFSWAELVFRIRRGAPDRNLVVWDFDLPSVAALPFVTTMLDIDAHDLRPQIEAAISPEKLPVGSGSIDYSDGAMATAVERLDARYELDLDEIDSMNGVTLIRHEAIPAEFHL
jgi:hypothetical protein